MADTQWPRFQVFQQTKEGEPHHNAGSVHAPDAELALLNARDVFVRRPDCANLWVVPADQIFAKTAQELETWETETAVDPSAPVEAFCVFQKRTHRGTHTYAGAVEAAGPAQALRRALETWGDREALVWWVFPARLVTRSDPDDVESMFQPAHDKAFRHQTEYQTVTLMRQFKEEEA